MSGDTNNNDERNNVLAEFLHDKHGVMEAERMMLMRRDFTTGNFNTDAMFALTFAILALTVGSPKADQILENFPNGNLDQGAMHALIVAILQARHGFEVGDQIVSFLFTKDALKKGYPGVAFMLDEHVQAKLDAEYGFFRAAQVVKRKIYTDNEVVDAYFTTTFEVAFGSDTAVELIANSTPSKLADRSIHSAPSFTLMVQRGKGC